MKEKISVLIVEDHLGFAQGMELLLLQHPKIAVVQIVQNFQDTLDELKSGEIDIVILDLHFETKDYDGFIISKKIKQLYSDIKVMILTQHARKEHYNRLFNECNVDAYLDKKLGIDETYYAIDEVLRGEKYIDHSIAEMLEIEGWMTISEREKEVISYLRTGLTQKEIAERMFIVPKTVEVHIRNLFAKFKVKNSVELIAKYLKYKNANRENPDETTPPFKEL